MIVEVEFDPRDDLDAENRWRIESSVLSTNQVNSCFWRGRTLVYDSDQPGASEVIDSWQDEGFVIEEFVSFTFKRR